MSKNCLKNIEKKITIPEERATRPRTMKAFILNDNLADACNLIYPGVLHLIFYFVCPLVSV